MHTIKEKLPEALPTLRRLLVSMPLEINENPTPEEVARWAEVIHTEDAAILAAAVAAQPDYLVTGDKHFYPGTAEKSGLHIVTPSQFLERLEEGTEPPQ